MKKLGKLKLNPEKMLKNEELVSFRGGSGGGSCAAVSSTGTCLCDASKTEAIFWADCDSDGTNCTGNWCCDSCSSASWYSQCC